VDDGERTLDGLPARDEMRERRQGGQPRWVTVWIGLDVGKEEHFADVLDDNGDPLFAKSIGNDEADLVALLERAQEHGTPALVIDQPGSIAQLAIAVAARRGVPVAYVAAWS